MINGRNSMCETPNSMNRADDPEPPELNITRRKRRLLKSYSLNVMVGQKMDTHMSKR
jgi:hypothetical protein